MLKAVAFGARGVGLGRPFLWAQAAYGEQGVIRAVRSKWFFAKRHWMLRQGLLYGDHWLTKRNSTGERDCNCDEAFRGHFAGSGGHEDGGVLTGDVEVAQMHLFTHKSAPRVTYAKYEGQKGIRHRPRSSTATASACT